ITATFGLGRGVSGGRPRVADTVLIGPSRPGPSLRPWPFPPWTRTPGGSGPRRVPPRSARGAAGRCRPSRRCRPRCAGRAAAVAVQVLERLVVRAPDVGHAAVDELAEGGHRDREGARGVGQGDEDGIIRVRAAVLAEVEDGAPGLLERGDLLLGGHVLLLAGQ